MARRRTRARLLALKALYQWDMLRESSIEHASAYLDAARDDDVRAYAVLLFEGVTGRKDELDAAIAKVAQNWDVSRMARIDRNVLRLAAWEMLFGGEVPRNAAINEAVELAKKYGSEKSGAFVNGILDALEHQKPDALEEVPS